MKTFLLGVAAAEMIFDASAALAGTGEEKAAKLEQEKVQKEEEKKLGSLYLRCDGKPNNMTDGESFARFVGAVTLLALFAPSPESPDPAKRLFAEKGVEACTRLIDGEKAEGNGLRRLPLILARGLHQIEAKNYQAALDDVAKARAEAAALGLIGNPYFDRSMGLSFGRIEAEARLRMGDPAGAQAASLNQVKDITYGFVPLLLTRTYAGFNRELRPEEERVDAATARILAPTVLGYAARLEEVGRFADAAVQHEAMIATVEGLKAKEKESSFYARAAIGHALAGEWDRAKERADFARSNMADRRARGVPDDDSSRIVELLDLYEVLRLEHDGQAAQARRNFAARSQWVEPSLGQVMEADRRLREGASSGELFGALAKAPEELWQERRDAELAVKLQADTDNKELFNLILPYAKIDDFEGRSNVTWRVAKSKMMAEKPDEDSGMWRLFSAGNVQTAADSIVLHAALQAQAKGKEGFTLVMLPPSSKTAYGPVTIAWVHFADRSETGAEASRFLSADQVVAELSQVIPSPETLKARKKQTKAA
ncbi:MAG: hypothetical protein P0Y56_11820 [Candidatus Andeanibacterium colombiense]|uniref:Uncharacterized protein n=1 Tax=Candidatus Andeanibacterium colombiense TaxID=3121345 RepID=A0AAJ6BNT7_9SPHN|nr:MAG: hypothetical protein P0Y56_11820 [Sphingomonadaceae bacterium]